LPKSRDCNAANGLSQADESTCAQAHEIDRSDGPRQDPLARHDDPCGRDLVYGATVHCVPAVAAPRAVWPLAWIGWPFYLSFQHPLQAPRVRVWRRRFFHPSVDEPADESGGDGHRERG
jgi:hypothetical protein